MNKAPEMSAEDKLKLGEDELKVLKDIWLRWLKSDFDWAVNYTLQYGRNNEEDEWDFLRREWIGKYDEWLYPYIYRLYRTEHITQEQKDDFSAWADNEMMIKLEALYSLEVTHE